MVKTMTIAHPSARTEEITLCQSGSLILGDSIVFGLT